VPAFEEWLSQSVIQSLVTLYPSSVSQSLA
jgi:hypothetical protein